MDSTINCICSVLEEINEFYSINEFERFSNYLNKLIESGELIEIPVESFYAGFEEKWYKCSMCENVWRLVYPDFPFKGFWIKMGREK